MPFTQRFGAVYFSAEGEYLNCRVLFLCFLSSVFIPKGRRMFSDVKIGKNIVTSEDAVELWEQKYNECVV